MSSIDAYTQKVDKLRDSCPVKVAIDVIRGRWKPFILHELYAGVQRFSGLQATLPGISAQVLTVQLRQLEADGIIIRTVYPEVPMWVEYELSEIGQSLVGVMEQLEAWGTHYQQQRMT